MVGVLAHPSENFEKKGEYWYDDWGVTRNCHYGEDGYLPQIIHESLWQYSERAYEIGKLYMNEYPNRITRAKAILKFVQTWVEYTYDEENEVVTSMLGETQDEWAWNPDEMAFMVDQARKNKEKAYGDCEDHALFLAVLYLAAGYNMTIVDAPEHVALMIWLPEYPNANKYWDIKDGRGKGWIWVEATNDAIPLGYTPEDFKDDEKIIGFHPYETTEHETEQHDEGNGNGKGGICIIATTTYGSELAPEVRFLRGFRDNLALSTFAGSQFIQVFNAWYYSFSPAVAGFIAQQPIVKAVMRAILYPLIGILHLSSETYHVFGFNPELSVVMAGLVASSLIGTVYFSLPAAILLALTKRFRGNALKLDRLKIVTVPLPLSVATIVLGELTQCQSLMMVSTTMFVLTTLSTSALTVGIKIAEKLPPKN